MQQYYKTDTPHTLSVFHTPEGHVSLDIEHYGCAVLEDTEELESLYNRECEKLAFTGREHRGFKSTTEAVIERLDDGVDVQIQGTKGGETQSITVSITESQLERLVKSTGSGDDSVGYDVESVER